MFIGQLRVDVNGNQLDTRRGLWETNGMFSGLIVILLVATFVFVLSATLFILTVFVHLTVVNKRLTPSVVALFSAAGAAVVMIFVGFPQVRLFSAFIPILCAAIGMGLSLSRSDWNLLVVSPIIVQPSRWRDTWMLVGGTVGAVAGIATGVGRRILLALNYDVLGNTPAEISEIRVAGGTVGFLSGAIVSLFIWGVAADSYVHEPEEKGDAAQ